MTQVSRHETRKMVAVIQIQDSERNLRHVMKDGSSLMLGSDSRCGVVLDAPGVAPRHCVMHMDGGKVFVTDWYSESGTLVNGEKIYTETVFHPGDQMVVGGFRIQFQSSNVDQVDRVQFGDEETGIAEASGEVAREPGGEAGVPPVPVEDPRPQDDPLPAAGPAAVSAGLAAVSADLAAGEPAEEFSDLAAGEPPQAVLPESGGLLAPPGTVGEEPAAAAAPRSSSAAASEYQGEEARLEIERLRRELDYQKALAAMNPGDDSPFDDVGEPADGQTSLLREEIEHLQLELNRRDEEIEELMNRSANGSPAVPGETADSGQLVERLDQLLGELQHSDERVRNLETLLQTADDAAQAEREEREQLGIWVSEIESRIAEREQQWTVEQQRLEAQLAEATERYERAEQNAEQVVRLHADEFQQNVQQQVVELTRRNEQLAAGLAEARTARQEMEHMLESAGASPEEIADLANQQEELKAGFVEIAQERASITRQRAELARLRDELESAAGQNQNMDNPDCRIRQFREHLREIHENEQKERQQRGLGGRIARLWRRVDGG